MRRDDPTHHRWPLGDKGNKQREWGWVSAERLPAAVSVSCLPDSMTSVRSSRAIVRYPTWIATTTSRPRRPWESSAQSAARGVMWPSSPGTISPWIAAACGWRLWSFLRDLRPLSRPVPTLSSQTPDTALTPVRGERTGVLTSGLCLRLHLLALLLDGPYGEGTYRRCRAHQGRIQAAHPEGLGAHGAPRLGPSPPRPRPDLITHGPAYRGANGAVMPTDEGDQDGHFFYNHPERGGYSAA